MMDCVLCFLHVVPWGCAQFQPAFIYGSASFMADQQKRVDKKKGQRENGLTFEQYI